MKRLGRVVAVVLVLVFAATLFPASVFAAAAERAASIIQSSIPTQMVSGSQYSVSITVKNTGTESWTAAKGFRLVPLKNNPFTKAIGNLGSAETIKPGASKKFTFTLTGPSAAASYTAGWRMNKGSEAFGSSVSKVIKVVSLKLTSMFISKLPKKLSYYTYEDLDLAGLVVTGVYNNGTKKQLAITRANITGFTSSRTGTFRVTINVSGLKKTFLISVIRMNLSSITVKSLPKKLVYAVGESLDLTGASMIGVYSNGKTKVLYPASAAITGFNSSKVVTGQLVTLTMNGKTVKFKVNIVPNALMNARTAAYNVLKAALAGYTQSDYSTDNWKALNLAKTNGDKAIGAAQTTAAVTNAQKAALAAMDAVKTLAEEAAELNKAKAAALAALTKELAKYSATNYSTDGWAKVNKAKQDGDTAINASDTIAKVTKALDDAVKAMAAVIKLDAETLTAAKAAAYTDLTNALNSYSEEDYSAANWTILTKAKTDGDKAIAAAATVSAVTAARNTAISAMAAVKNLGTIELDVLKAAACADLNAILAVYNQSNYSAANWQALLAAKTAGDAAVKNAATAFAVDNAKSNAISAMAAIKTKTQEGQELTEAKAAAHQSLTAALGGYSAGDYSPEKWLLLNAAKTSGDTAIDGATTIAGVNSAKSAALAAMDAVLTFTEELAKAKTDAKAALLSVLAGYNSQDYSTANWTALNNAKTAGDAAIQAAATLEAVASAKAAAVTAMSQVKTKAVEASELASAKVNACNMLNLALAGFSQGEYTTENWQALRDAKTAGDTAINAATTISQVTNAMSDAIQAMNDIEKLPG